MQKLKKSVRIVKDIDNERIAFLAFFPLFISEGKDTNFFSPHMCCSNSTVCPNKIFTFQDTVAKRVGVQKPINRFGFVEISDKLSRMLFLQWQSFFNR